MSLAQKFLGALVNPRNWRAVIKGLSLLLAGIVLIQCLILLYPPLYILGLALLGRSPVCSTLAAFAGARNYYHGRTKHREIANGSQLVERAPVGIELWETPLGRFWIPSGSETVLPILLAQQESLVYEQPGTVQIKKGDIVFDCGAHIGVFARKALNQGAAVVVAIEPSPINLECLRRNFAKEIAGGSVFLVAEGVWDKEDVLTFFTNPENSSGDSFLIRSSRAGMMAIRVTTVDKIRDDLKLSRVDFIKIDVEGAAERVLRGSAKTLSEFAPRLAVSTEEETDDPTQLAQAVNSLQPRYRMQCGHCAIQDNLVDPAVLFFY